MLLLKFRKLFSHYLDTEIQEMHENNVQLHFIGDLTALHPILQKKMAEAEKLTAENTGVCFNVAVNYGGHSEILMATRAIGQDMLAGKLTPEGLNEQVFAEYLYTKKQPPVDLLIRTGGDYRISNFLLWQSAYAELYFSEKNWPDFSPADFEMALCDFQKRERRFGSIKA